MVEKKIYRALLMENESGSIQGTRGSALPVSVTSLDFRDHPGTTVLLERPRRISR